MVELVLVVADDDQRVEPSLAQEIAEPRHRRLDSLVPRLHALRGDLRRDIGRRALQLRLIGREVAVGVEQVGALRIALDRSAANRSAAR
jgi:hypothetical protein